MRKTTFPSWHEVTPIVEGDDSRMVGQPCHFQELSLVVDREGRLDSGSLPSQELP